MSQAQDPSRRSGAKGVRATDGSGNKVAKLVQSPPRRPNVRQGST